MENPKKSAFVTKKDIIKMVAAFVLIPVIVFSGLLGGAIWLLSDHGNAGGDEIDSRAAEYITQNYPNNDFVLEKAYYAFKESRYLVNVRSQSSQDTYFQLVYDPESYELTRDYYESYVLSGSNTRKRLENAYNALVEQSLSPMTNLHTIKASFTGYAEEMSYDGRFSPEGLKTESLTLDEEYDVVAMGKDYGYIYISAILPKEEVNLVSAMELLRQTDQRLSDTGIGYYLIEISIRDEEYLDYTVSFNLYNVHPEDLHREDALVHLQELWDAQEAHRQEVKKQYEDN